MEIYSGYLKDNKALSQSASGGCATAISLYVCVYGVEYSEEFGFKQGLKSNKLYRMWLRNTKIKHLKNLIKKALNRDKV